MWYCICGLDWRSVDASTPGHPRDFCCLLLRDFELQPKLTLSASCGPFNIISTSAHGREGGSISDHQTAYALVVGPFAGTCCRRLYIDGSEVLAGSGSDHSSSWN